MADDDLRPYLRDALSGLLGDPDLRTLYAVYVLLFAVTELYAQALPLYFRALGIPVAVLGLAKSVGAVLEVVASPVVGVLADRRDRFLLAAVAGGVLVAGFVGLSLARTPGALVALVAVVSVGRLALSTATTPAVDAALDAEFAGVGWGLRDVGIYLGSALGLALGGVVLSTLSESAVFLALVPVLAVLTWLLYRGRGDEEGTEDGAGDDARSLRSRLRSALSPSLPTVPNPRVLARLAVVQGLATFGTAMSLFLLPVFAVDLGIDAVGFLLLFAGSYLVSAPLSLVGGIAADRRDRKHLYVANYLVEAVMLLAFGLAGSIPLFLVGTALYVVQTAFEPAVIAFFFDQFDEDAAGTAWGIDGTVAKAAGVVAPVAGSLLYGVDPRLTFLVAGGLLLCATAVGATLPRPGETA